MFTYTYRCRKKPIFEKYNKTNIKFKSKIDDVFKLSIVKKAANLFKPTNKAQLIISSNTIVLKKILKGYLTP